MGVDTKNGVADRLGEDAVARGARADDFGRGDVTGAGRADVALAHDVADRFAPRRPSPACCPTTSSSTSPHGS